MMMKPTRTLALAALMPILVSSVTAQTGTPPPPPGPYQVMQVIAPMPQQPLVPQTQMPQTQMPTLQRMWQAPQGQIPYWMQQPSGNQRPAPQTGPQFRQGQSAGGQMQAGAAMNGAAQVQNTNRASTYPAYPVAPNFQRYPAYPSQIPMPYWSGPTAPFYPGFQSVYPRPFPNQYPPQYPGPGQVNR